MRGQTLWDIAIQAYGSIEGVFLLIADNPDQLDSLDDDLVPGQVLRIKSDPVDRDMATYYKVEDLHPASREVIVLGGAWDEEAYTNAYDNQHADL